MKADQYRAWQRLPANERIRAVMDLNLELYALKGGASDATRLQRTLVRIQRRPRLIFGGWRVRGFDARGATCDEGSGYSGWRRRRKQQSGICRAREIRRAG